MGAVDSPYKYGLFILKLIFPEDYPNKGPIINFLTPIYHINVCSSKIDLGRVSFNTINYWKVFLSNII